MSLVRRLGSCVREMRARGGWCIGNRSDSSLVLSGKRVAFQVAEVKRFIETSQGKTVYPAEQQMLIHQGKILKDNTTLDENKVSENSFLVIMFSKTKRSSSGASSTTKAPANQTPAVQTPVVSPSQTPETTLPMVPTSSPVPTATITPAPPAAAAPVPNATTVPAPVPTATTTPAPAVAPVTTHIPQGHLHSTVEIAGSVIGALKGELAATAVHCALHFWRIIDAALVEWPP